jgi:hypothetical protein
VRLASVLAILPVLFLAACEKPVPAAHVRFRLDRQQHVSLGLFDGKGNLVAQPLVGQRFEAGQHDIDCSGPDIPAGRWSWKAVAYDRSPPELMASVAAGTADLNAPGELSLVAGGDEGPPCAVAADQNAVFLGWRAARNGHEIVALDPGGRTLWAHHHGTGRSGIVALATADGVVYVLGGNEGAGETGEAVYKLDAQTGAPVHWDGREELELKVESLWPADARTKPQRAGAIAAKNGRVYLTFIEDQFIAALDAVTGAYVITLTAPFPTQLALSITPMVDPQDPTQRKVIDFGVCAIARHGLAYFVMEHDPAWVMMSTTRWLPDDEEIVALTLRGDTMKTEQVTIYTALGAPHHQIQLRPAEAAEGFSVAIGTQGGRPARGPWRREAFRNIRSLAVDAAGQLWVAEGDQEFGRFTVWKTEGTVASLEREIFGPIKGNGFAIDSSDGTEVIAGGFRWKIDPANHTANCVETASPPESTASFTDEYRDAHGLLLWSPKMLTDERISREGWQVIPLKNGQIVAAQRGAGVHLFALPKLDKSLLLATGEVEIKGK